MSSRIIQLFAAPEAPKHRRAGLWIALSSVAAVALLLLLAWEMNSVSISDAPFDEGLAAGGPAVSPKLEKEFQAVRPKGYLIVIDTAANRLYLRRNGDVLLEARCSTGSGLKLVAKEQTWTFQTPRGSFRVISKTENPWWRKPDWAFLEEGEPPPKEEAERYERGVLGDYALGIGDGYFIHGTLYARLLGRNVTHGCIRLDEGDLKYLAQTVPMGTRVFIF